MSNLFDNGERALATQFLSCGYVIADAANSAALERIRTAAAQETAKFLGVSTPPQPGTFLDEIAHHVSSETLNDLRLHLINALPAFPWFREAYFGCARPLLETLVGNELAMQRGMGLSIQLPGDDSSLLPLHSDAWSEDSPFEVVLWIPLVDCYRTKSMFILPREKDALWRDKVHEYARTGVHALFKELEAQVQWLDIPYGKVLLFTHTLMHGNHINRESTTRWSINMRFKGLFTPYSDKRLGEFFEPITIRPASRIGMQYELPGGFHE